MQACPRWRAPCSFGPIFRNIQPPTFLVPPVALRSTHRPKHTFASPLTLDFRSRSHNYEHVLANSAGTPYARPNSSNVTATPSDRVADPGSVNELSEKQLGRLTADVESLLPLTLRSGTIQYAPRVSEESLDLKRQRLVQILSDALPHDILSYLALNQGRWSAVIWIVRTLLSSPKGRNDGKLDIFQSQPISHGKESLDIATSHAVVLEPRSPRLLCSLDEYTNYRRNVAGSRITPEAENARNGVARILQSLGHMILKAADQPEDESRKIISKIRQIIALLHHSDVLPEGIYKHVPVENALVVQRPPTLHLLSSRILASLSDATWRAQEEAIVTEAAAVGAKYHYMGYEVPGARYRVKVRDLGPEVWMELLLWTCVEGGYFDEAAYILRDLRSRKDKQKWSVIDWAAVEDPEKRPDLRGNARVDWEAARRRPGGPLGQIEAYSYERPLVEMGDRTISSEVVIALIDGLVDSINVGVGARGLSPTRVIGHITVLKNILERDQYGLGPNSWTQVILKLTESPGIDLSTSPRLLENVLKLTPPYKKEFEAVNAPRVLDPSQRLYPYSLEQSAAPFGLLHDALTMHIKDRNVHGALRVFSRLISLSDTNKQRSIRDFMAHLKHDHLDEDHLDAQGYLDVTEIPGFFPFVPYKLMGHFLALLTEAKEFGIGEWLLYAEEVDGPSIPEWAYPVMTKPLLEFAAATSDGDLLTKVSKTLKPPLRRPTVRMLLECQIALGKWASVEEMVDSIFRSSEPWSAAEAMLIADGVLRLHSQARTTDPMSSSQLRECVDRSESIFTRFMHGEYGLPGYGTRSSNTSPAAQRSREALLRHLQDICSAASPVLAALCPSEKNHPLEGQKVAHRMATRFFNKLLGGVIALEGPAPAIRLVDRYCTASHRHADPQGRVPRLPRAQPRTYPLNVPGYSDGLSDEHDLEMGWVDRHDLQADRAPELVQPDVMTIRTIASAVVQGLKAEGGSQLLAVSQTPSSSSASIAGGNGEQRVPTADANLQWVVERFRDLGLDDEEIDEHIEGFFLPGDNSRDLQV